MFLYIVLHENSPEFLVRAESYDEVRIREEIFEVFTDWTGLFYSLWTTREEGKIVITSIDYSFSLSAEDHVLKRKLFNIPYIDFRPLKHGSKENKINVITINLINSADIQKKGYKVEQEFLELFEDNKIFISKPTGLICLMFEIDRSINLPI